MTDLRSENAPWSKKRKLLEKALLARESRCKNAQDRSVTDGDDGPSIASSSLNESLTLPAVSDHESEDNKEIDFSANEIYKEWIGCQTKDNVKMMAIILMDTFRLRFGLTDVAAATEAGLVVGFNEQTIRNWRNDFYENDGEFSDSAQGKHSRPYVLDDEDCRKKALSWLRENVHKKGQPNMTSAMFATWVNVELLPNCNLPPGFPRSISPRTARKWLHDLGFTPKQYKKGLYFDGHEREDVVEYRDLYLRKIEILQSSHLPPPNCFNGGETEEVIGNNSADKRLVLIYHDESSFHANEGQSWQWAEEDKLALRPKSQGRGLMVSDFIDEHCGYLRLTPEEEEVAKLSQPDLPVSARVIFRFGAQGDGYWNNEHFISQVITAIKIAEFKYPATNNTIVFLFDQSSGHCAFADDALIAHKMNVSDGGKQPYLRDTVWDGKPQKMVTSDGLQKGLKRVLQERGVNVKKMLRDDMIKVLEEMRDFKFQRTRVEELILSKGHRVMFIPKFHCEINPIERVWCRSKQYTRAHCDYTFPGLEQTIELALDSVDVQLMRKYFRKVREYHRAYRNNVKTNQNNQLFHHLAKV